MNAILTAQAAIRGALTRAALEWRLIYSEETERLHFKLYMFFLLPSFCRLLSDGRLTTVAVRSAVIKHTVIQRAKKETRTIAASEQ